MTLFEIFATLISLAALFGYINFRFLKLPTTIGMMAMALVLSLILIWVGQYSPSVFEAAREEALPFQCEILKGGRGAARACKDCPP